MASSFSCASFDFVLKRFSTPINGLTECKINVHADGDLISCINNDGKISVRSLSEAEDATVLPLDDRIVQFCWVHRVKDSAALPSCLTVSSQGHLSLHEVGVTGSATHSRRLLSTCKIQCHQRTLAHILHTDAAIDYKLLQNECRFLCCHDNVATLLLGGHVVTLRLQSDKPPEVKGHFSIDPSRRPKLTRACGANAIAFVYGFGDIEIWNLTRKTKVAVVDVSLLDDVDDCDILDAAFTDDLQTLSIAFQRIVVIVDLEEYFRRFPTALQPSEDGGETKRESTETWFVRCGLTSLTSDSRGRHRPPYFNTVPGTTHNAVRLPAQTEKLIFRESRVNSAFVFVTFFDPEDGRSVLYAVDMATNNTVAHRLPANSVALLCDSLMVSPMAMTSDTLHKVVFNKQQELIIAKLMSTDVTSAADASRCFNASGRVSLEVLKVVLKKQRLDTIAFLLKNLEKDFDIQKVEAGSGTSSKEGERLSYDPTALNAASVVILTLTEEIDKQLARGGTARQFAEQLLRQTMEHLHKVVRQVVTQLQRVQTAGQSDESFKRATDDLLTSLTDHVMSLRERMMNIAVTPHQQSKFKQSQQAGVKRHRKSSSAAGSPRKSAAGVNYDFEMTPVQRNTVAVWETLDLKAAVVEGILGQQVALVQAYVSCRYGRQMAGLSSVIETGLAETLAFLREREMAYATTMLTNMGFHVLTKLAQICLYTPDRALRDYLAAHLQQQRHLAAEELDMLTFVRRLEALYPSSSFDACKSHRIGHVRRDWVDGPVSAEAPPGEKLGDQCGEIAETETTGGDERSRSGATVGYAHVLLEWTRRWDAETRARVLLDAALYGGDTASRDVRQSIPADVIWRYLCRRLDSRLLTIWVDWQLPLPVKGPESEPLLAAPPASSLDSLTETGTAKRTEIKTDPGCLPEAAPWPYCLNIDEGFLCGLENECPQFFVDWILDLLASRGMVCATEQADLDLLVRRLSRNGLLTGVECILANSVLHAHVVRMCVRESRPQLLWLWLDEHRLCVETADLLELGLASSEVPAWVSMLLHLRRVASHLSEPQLVFDASLAASRFVQNVPDCSIQLLIEDGFIGRALATLMYSKDAFARFTSAPVTEPLAVALAPFPRLHRALFPSHFLAADSTPELTVYHLLQGNVPFDITRLFGWQTTNSLAAGKFIDCESSLPHFNQEALCRRHAVTLTLDPTYYLLQARPSYAFCAFVHTQIQIGAKRLSKKRVQSASEHADWLALEHFNQSHVAAACVAFSEMLGRDTSRIRLHVQAANQIHSHRCSSIVGGDMEERRSKEAEAQHETGQLLYRCLLSGSGCVDALSRLAGAIRWHITKLHIDSAGWEAGQRWLPAVLFCKIHQMALPTAFLSECATTDDWLMFLTYAQLYQYPPAQLREILPDFASADLQEHLFYVLENVTGSAVASQSAHQGTQQSAVGHGRLQLHAKTGGKNKAERGLESSDSDDGEEEREDKDVEKKTLSPLEHELALHSQLPSRDIFDLLSACAAESSPWWMLCTCAVKFHNPVLAVLATCYEDHSTITCLCVWLVAVQTDGATNQADDISGSLAELTGIVCTLVAKSRTSLLHVALKIFQPDCALISFLQFYAGVVEWSSDEVCRQLLEQFIGQVAEKRSSPADDLPASWVEEIVIVIISDAMRSHTRASVIGRLLQFLDAARLDEIFTDAADVPDLKSLHQFHAIATPGGVRLNYTSLQCGGLRADEAYSLECDRAIAQLEQRCLFDEARQFALVALVPHDHVTINRLRADLATLRSCDAWRGADTRASFWRRCQQTLKRDCVKAEVASSFIQEMIPECETHAERGRLYQLAYDWLSGRGPDDEDEETKALFVNVWKCKIRDYLERKEESKDNIVEAPTSVELNRTPNIRPSELLAYIDLKTSASCERHAEQLTAEETSALDDLLGSLLNRCYIQEVFQVANCFQHFSQDQLIVQTCLRLAVKQITPDQLDAEMRRLIAAPPSERIRRASSSLVGLPRYSSVLSSASTGVATTTQSARECVEDSGDAMLAAMELLADRCTAANQCCSRIIANYAIGKVLCRCFEDVVATDSFVLLADLLSTDHPRRLYHAKALITTSQLDDLQVAGFLCDAILKALEVHPGNGVCDVRDLFQPIDSERFTASRGVTDLFQLCKDPSLLGQRLLDSAVSLASSNHHPSSNILSAEVELLVLSHECHTLACNMEGISAVLRASRAITTSLAELDSYSLMVHLLTGIGRFSEMTYIFDILKQQHQFELLFRKGIEKEDRLKLALLDYLKRNDASSDGGGGSDASSDTDTLTMVALHFTMYREIAHTLEQRAGALLSTLSADALANVSRVQPILYKALQYLSDAADTYTKENCPRRAERCLHQARLVALQVHLLATGVCIIHLSPDRLRAFVLSHAKFYEAYLVCCAYGVQTLWSDAIYHHTVQGGDFKYLQDLRSYIELSDTLIEEVADRYSHETRPSRHAAGAMKRLLSLSCPRVITAYTLASRLAFSGLADDMLTGGATGAYLRDTVGDIVGNST